MLINKSKGFKVFLKKPVLAVLVCMLFTSCATLPNKYKQDIDIELCLYAIPNLGVPVSTLDLNTDAFKEAAREFSKELEYKSWRIIENVTIDYCYLQPVKVALDGRHIKSKYIVLYKGYSNNVTIGSMIYDSESNKFITDKSVISSAQQLLESSKKYREIKLTTRYESYIKYIEDEQSGN